MTATVVGPGGTIEITNDTGDPIPVQVAGSLVPEAFDHIDLAYTGSDITGVTYRQGGPGGTVVATLTIAYSGGNITSVTRT